ncbi:MAG: hypothetical protein KF764_08570 [Labilithrix sp.]|nr:hypothetical protein [Labilithrix sp.]
MFVAIIDAVRQGIAARGIVGVTVDEGAEARVAQPVSGELGRIVFVPAPSPISFIPPTRIGDDASGRCQLWNTLFVFEVCFAGYDADAPTRDLAHKRRCYDLLELATQEIHRVYDGSYEWTSATWTDERKHGRHGAELVATLVLNIPLFSTPYPFAEPVPVPGAPKPVA